MALTGHLSEFSLSEILQFLARAQKTGLLTIQTCPYAKTKTSALCHIWLDRGRIVAATNCLDQQGLLKLIAQRGWISERVITKVTQVWPADTPLGLYLKSQGVLQAEQLKLLFRTQVLRQVHALFQLEDAFFEFDPKAPRPLAEMTGLSLPATDVALRGLRKQHDWTLLANTLPNSTGAEARIAVG
jgi:hypothetical protein